MIDAVVVSHNSSADLQRLLPLLAARSTVAKVIVVDSGSSDDSRQVAGRHAALLVQMGNKGYGAAVNHGASFSSAGLMMLMNPDVDPPTDDELSSMAHRFQSSRVGIVAPALRLLDGTLQDSARHFPTPQNLVRRRWFGRASGAVEALLPAPVPWVVGAFMLVRKSMFVELRGFDERFFMYMEDVDFCLRAQQRGFFTVIDPTVEIVHRHAGESRKSLMSPMTRHHVASAIRFFLKHPALLVGAPTATHQNS